MQYLNLKDMPSHHSKGRVNYQTEEYRSLKVPENPHSGDSKFEAPKQSISKFSRKYAPNMSKSNMKKTQMRKELNPQKYTTIGHRL